MRFEGFAGNAAAKEQLSRAFDSGRIPHAVLIDGPQGSGRATLARIVAQAAVCTGPGEKPCGKCRHCVNAAAGVHPDIMVYSADKPRGLPVDTVRQIRADAYIRPNDGDVKVYILLGVHNLGEQAQNALLKVLEEPPPGVLFVMTCDGRSRVLATVQSRCTLVTLGPVSSEEAVAALLAAIPTLSREDAEKAAALSGNLIGQAQKALGEGEAASGLVRPFVKALCGASEYEFVRLSGRFEKNGGLLAAFLELLPQLFRDALLLRSGLESQLSGCDEEALRLSKSFTLKQLYALCESSLDFRAALDRNANRNLLATALFSRLWLDAHSSAF